MPASPPPAQLAAERATGSHACRKWCAQLPVDALLVGLVAGTVSGIPSTVHAIATGRSPLAAARAAGSLLGKPTLTRGLLAHAGITAFWSAVITATRPRHGTVAGLGIAALDLGVIGRRSPAIRDLPQVPQVLDHVAFGIAATLTLKAISQLRS